MGKVSRFVHVGAVVALAGVLMGGGEPPPPPEPCGELAEQPVQVFNLYVQKFESAFPLDEATCDKLASQATAACHKTVSDCAACLDRLVGNLFKASKTVCSSDEDPKTCVAAAKAETDGIEEDLEFETDQAHGICEGKFFGALFSECLGILKS